MGIRVNAVSGGVVNTDALDNFPNKDEMLAMGERTPAGRIVEPQDLANAVAWLAGAESTMIVGQTLIIDGGYSLPA
jgi:enoyl-[acyl-carrier protein] reductase III